jgi:hypothetical protein
MPTGNTKLKPSEMIKAGHPYLPPSIDSVQSCAMARKGESHSIALGICSSSRTLFGSALLSSRMARLIASILFVFASALSGHCPQVYAQVTPAATRPLDLQVGAAFDLGSSDYTAPLLRGFGFYTTLDFRRHFGVEGEFHQLDDPNSAQSIYERTYEVGPRYVLHYVRSLPMRSSWLVGAYSTSLLRLVIRRPDRSQTWHTISGLVVWVQTTESGHRSRSA